MSGPVTFVNVIDVNPGKQQEVIDLLIEGTEKVISKRPGFISVTLLASLEKNRVINIARWESGAAVKATQADPAAADYAARTASLAQATPGLYTLVGELTG
ncbi:antibiotic biosynthesis monooxygenase family protein [Nesterenkonia aerolata]|uniref:Antibiotic biosynthesis monooxygenase n=1 Tax=Nesterenkonia aerolata TaxID=3074079 RepID=A0ABU2DUJ2_9MICC|nr:antibiotic biosynthesis monooxygenase [Nesterenkonia sp. LY-0111]MDR8020172.1 antibiotic biosynthesis monooxygenase [Nesterenkonia sp. LY-0111]